MIMRSNSALFPHIPLLGKARVSGLKTTAPIRWLLKDEPQIRSRFETWIAEGKTHGQLVVAGTPATEVEMRTLLDAGGSDKKLPTLPTVTLLWKTIRHPLSGELGLEISASDEDLDELEEWPARNKRLDELRATHKRRTGVTS